MERVIAQEVNKMPILDNIMDHEVLGPEIKRGLALGREQGLEEGIEQGIEKGRHDGELAMLLRLIEKRFGPAPAAARDRLAKMSVSEVEEVALRLLEARSLEELMG